MFGCSYKKTNNKEVYVKRTKVLAAIHIYTKNKYVKRGLLNYDYGTSMAKLAGLFDLARTHSSRKNLEAPKQGTVERPGLLLSSLLSSFPWVRSSLKMVPSVYGG